MTSYHFLSLAIVSLLNTLNAQTGEGCFYKTCDITGQVRINAIIDAQGNHLGGCNCGCDPTVECPYPNVVNFDPNTQFGDCSCLTPMGTIYDPTGTNTNPANTAAPHTNAPNLWLYPDLPAGMVPAPQMPDYGRNGPAFEVLCDGSVDAITGMPIPCECPIGHQGSCIITCDGTDACVEIPIDCNNDGFQCTVNCVSENACEATNINAPIHGFLTVNCIGEFACEGGTTFNALESQDLQVNCNGVTSCAESIFNFGFGRSIVACNGEPDSCVGAVFNLYPNAANTVGAQFSCLGLFCPATAPAPFSHAFGPFRQTCTGAGDCSCPPGTTAECTIICEGTADACKDGTISCNNDGLPCTVQCNDEQSCGGAAVINGPTDGSLTVQCNGVKACEGAVTFNGQSGTDMAVACNGGEACKGGPVYNFGSGIGQIECNGPNGGDTCVGVATVNLLPHARTMAGAAFSCIGLNCPSDMPAAFNNAGAPPRVVPLGNVPTVVTPMPNTNANYPNPILPQIPAVPSVPVQVTPTTTTDHCCRIGMPGMDQWKGRCWYYTNQAGCLGEEWRCVWDTNNCLAQTPTCTFSTFRCSVPSDCCSGICLFDLVAGSAEGMCY